MKITDSNEYPNTGTLTILSDEDPAQTDANLETPDFSEKYTSIGSSAIFDVQKTFAGSDRFPCSFVAVAGHNFGDDGGSLQLIVNSSVIGSVDFSDDNRNSVVLFTFTEVPLCDEVEILYTKGTSTNQITVTFIAAGTYLEVPNDGEQSGYPRPWLGRNIRQRVQDNDEAGPVLVATQRISTRQTLTVANMGRSFAEGTWRDFLDFAASEPFFIRERDDNERSSYLCFDPRLTPPKAHSQTRELDVAAINFQAYTGT